MPGAATTLCDVALDADQLDTGKRIVDECEMLIVKLATIHEVGLEVPVPVPVSRVLVPRTL